MLKLIQVSTITTCIQELKNINNILQSSSTFGQYIAIISQYGHGVEINNKKAYPRAHMGIPTCATSILPSTPYPPHYS